MKKRNILGIVIIILIIILVLFLLVNPFMHCLGFNHCSFPEVDKSCTNSSDCIIDFTNGTCDLERGICDYGISVSSITLCKDNSDCTEPVPYIYGFCNTTISKCEHVISYMDRKECREKNGIWHGNGGC